MWAGYPVIHPTEVSGPQICTALHFFSRSMKNKNSQVKTTWIKLEYLDWGNKNKNPLKAFRPVPSGIPAQKRSVPTADTKTSNFISSLIRQEIRVWAIFPVLFSIHCRQRLSPVTVVHKPHGNVDNQTAATMIDNQGEVWFLCLPQCLRRSPLSFFGLAVTPDYYGNVLRKAKER